MTIPERSEIGRYAEDVFFIKSNSVNLYFEDSGQENLYLTIAKKCLPHHKIVKVFTLNGKDSIISHSNNPDNFLIPNRFYIIDRDFSVLLGSSAGGDNIIILDRFCIENYFIDSLAIAEVVVESNPKEERDAVARRIDCETYLSGVSTFLEELFGLFLLCQHHRLAIENTGCPPERFFQDKARHRPCSAKLAKYRSRIAKTLGVESEEFDPMRIMPPQVVSAFVGASLHEKISGKFLLAAIFLHIKSMYPMGSITFSSFVYRTMKNSELDSLRRFFLATPLGYSPTP